MKRFGTACFILVVAMLVTAVIGDAVAQVVKVKIEAMSPRGRSSGPPNYTSPPAGTPNMISTGLRVVGKGTKVYVSADTLGSGSTPATSFAWSFDGRPAGSTTTFDSAAGNIRNSFTADTIGFYYVRVTVNGTVSAQESFWVSTYRGVTDFVADCGCHMLSPEHVTIYNDWKNTKHATMFTRGISGQLEVEEYTSNGVYSTNCIKCHTTGWESVTANDNYGYLAKASGFDTSWYKSYSAVSSEFLIPYRDSTAVNLMKNSYPQLVGVANIGCEACHGPAVGHTQDFSNATEKIDVSSDAGVCNQCHDAPQKYRIGSYWAASKHGVLETGLETNRTSCFPCHSGTAFVKWLRNKGNPGYDTGLKGDGDQKIACQTCHDPHTLELRAMSIDSLRNGYRPPTGLGGKGLLCMNCHNARYSVKSRVTSTPPYYGYVNRFGPHENGQADMYFGSNGYQYGDSRLTGQMTHAGLDNSCVTCHMQERVVGSSVHSNHEMSMEDTTLGFRAWDVCRTCHGSGVTKFDDIKAFADYDGDGAIEGVQSEVGGLLERLKGNLPLDASTGEPVNMLKDSLAVKNRPDLVQAIWNYYFVKNDKSMGVHNTKYSVALLQKSLGLYTDVEALGGDVPQTFALNQNYPNPFNPTTTISFSLPQKENVRLEVYDVLGKLVKTLVSNELGTGNYSMTWDGRDERGSTVATGMYLYRLQAGSFSAVKKMLLVK